MRIYTNSSFLGLAAAFLALGYAGGCSSTMDRSGGAIVYRSGPPSSVSYSHQQIIAPAPEPVAVAPVRPAPPVVNVVSDVPLVSPGAVDVASYEISEPVYDTAATMPPLPVQEQAIIVQPVTVISYPAVIPYRVEPEAPGWNDDGGFVFRRETYPDRAFHGPGRPYIGPPAAVASRPNLSEARVLGDLQIINQGAIQISQAGIARVADPDAAAQAQQMIADRTAANQKLDDLRDVLDLRDRQSSDGRKDAKSAQTLSERVDRQPDDKVDKALLNAQIQQLQRSKDAIEERLEPSADLKPVQRAVHETEKQIKEDLHEVKALKQELNAQDKAAAQEQRALEKAQADQKQAQEKAANDAQRAQEQAQKEQLRAQEQARKDEQRAQEQARKDEQRAQEQARKDEQRAQAKAKEDEKRAQDKAEQEAKASEKAERNNKSK